MALGGTIRELQAKMSHNEFRIWRAYRRKHGPMNDLRRHDRPAALIASILSAAHGGKARMQDFMVFGRGGEKQEATLQDVISEFGGVNLV